MIADTVTNLIDTLKVVTAQFNYEQPLQAQLSSVLEALANSHGFVRPHIVLFDPETGLLKLRVAQNEPRRNHEEYAPGKGITGQVFATAKSIIAPKMSQDKTLCNLLFTRTQKELDELAFICVPIFAAPSLSDASFVPREVLGTLGTDSISLGIDDLEVRRQFLEVLANLISMQVAYFQTKNFQNNLQGNQNTELPTETLPFVAHSKKMKLLLEQANAFALSSSPVLLYGEKGTGKEYFARRIHSLSSKRFLPFTIFYADNTSNDINETIKSMCGYVKNAFPSALQTKKGIFEASAHGTLYIDSIHKLPLEAQKILLKVLTEGAITRIGSEQSVQLSMRIIASTDSTLDELVKTGDFLEELALRLKFQHTNLPPLRERREDIIPLAEFFLKQDAQEQENTDVKRISYPAIELLSSYYYSGNIPELKASIQHAIEHCEDSVIRATDLPPSIQTASSTNTKSDLPLTEAVSNFEKELIVDALVKANGNMFKAAQDLKTSYRIINYKIKKYNLNAKKYTKN